MLFRPGGMRPRDVTNGREIEAAPENGEFTDGECGVVFCAVTHGCDDNSGSCIRAYGVWILTCLLCSGVDEQMSERVTARIAVPTEPSRAGVIYGTRGLHRPRALATRHSCTVASDVPCHLDHASLSRRRGLPIPEIESPSRFEHADKSADKADEKLSRVALTYNWHWVNE